MSTTIVNNNNNNATMVFTGTDKLDGSALARGKFLRRSTNHTASTSCLTIEDPSEEFYFEDDIKDGENDELLVRMMAREMVSSVVRNKNLSGDSISSRNIDQEIRNALKAQFVIDGELMNDADEEYSSARSVSNDSKKSKASSVEKATSDIDFFNLDIADILAQCEEEDVTEKAPTSDEDDTDNLSVVSDITEYTTHVGRRSSICCPEITVQACTSTKTRSVSSSSDSSSKKSVSFSDVSVRVYKRIISDNPSCTSGPGLGIDWEYRQVEYENENNCSAALAISLDDYEKLDRGVKTNLLLTRIQREKILRKLGYSEKDIVAAVREISRVKKQRQQTVHNLGCQKMELAVESAKLKVFKLFKSNKRQ